jgi:hypothetical protein
LKSVVYICDSKKEEEEREQKEDIQYKDILERIYRILQPTHNA